MAAVCLYQSKHIHIKAAMSHLEKCLLGQITLTSVRIDHKYCGFYLHLHAFALANCGLEVCHKGLLVNPR